MKKIKIIDKLVAFLKEVRVEIKKVVWPSRQYVAMATVIVLLIVLIMGAFTWLLDLMFSKIMLYLMKNFG